MRRVLIADECDPYPPTNEDLIMLLREKGEKNGEPVSMGWDEAQAAISAGTHEVAEGAYRVGDQPDPGADYEGMSRTELDALAAERGVDVTTAKNKGDVIEALRKAS